MSRNTAIVVSILVALLVCCLCIVCIGGYFAWQASQLPIFGQALTQVSITASPSPAPNLNVTPVPTPLPGSASTLDVLSSEVIPINDLRDIAMRLKGIPDIPQTVGDKNNDWPIGQELDFSATNTDTNQTFQLRARLIYKTDNVYFFAQDSVSVDEDKVKTLLDDFQTNTYPTTRDFFGAEPNPGVDGDPHIYILYARGLGFSIAGYQSSADGYSKLAQEDSNEKEMYYINADTTSLADSSLRYTLAHEFQHMIHGFHDRNEDTWVNEGSSVLSQFLNGDRSIYFDSSFTRDPDLQLNTWSEGGAFADPAPHYGAGFLFLDYFLDRFGHAATQTLVSDVANGLTSVNDVLTDEGVTENGQAYTAIDLFADWVIANYLNDPSLGDGRYAYHNYPEMPKISGPTETIRSCPTQEVATVHQFAADYVQINCSGNFTLEFTGSQQIRVVPTEPHSGRYFFWGNRGDKSDTTLTREFDLKSLSSATLKYWTWYAIESDYDFAYVEVSTDGGQTYTILSTPSCTSEDPSGNNFGCGYSGDSGDDPARWIEETVDLSPYAGQTILVRFEYITDDAVNRNGWLLDDLSLPELNYTEDFENGEGGWDGQGFVRIDNFLPQQYIVQIIKTGATPTVDRLPLNSNNQGSINLTLSASEPVTIVVSGVTQFTTEVASYQLEIK